MADTLRNAYISGTGFYVPEKILTNDDLEKMVDTDDAWITQRTGIKERHIIEPGTPTSALAAEAAKKAIAQAGITANDIDMIIVATITPDMIFPATAALVQEKIGASKAATFDLEAACSGFIYGVSIATQFIRTGTYEAVLVIGAETLTNVTDWEDRGTCVLFGDGAGAAVIQAAPKDSPSSILSFELRGDGSYKHLLNLPAGGSLNPTTHKTVDERLHYMKMTGNEVFRVAVKNMAAAVQTALEKCGKTVDDLKMLIPHQANVRIIKSVGKRLGMDEEKVFVNIQKYGNTSAATVPIALAEVAASNLLQRGDLFAMVAFGGGFTWAASILRW